MLSEDEKMILCGLNWLRGYIYSIEKMLTLLGIYMLYLVQLILLRTVMLLGSDCGL
jgi:hypothetical protein